MLEQQVKKCVELADNLSGRRQPYDGGASFKLEYHPYDDNWRAVASWSGGFRYITFGKFPETATEKLLNILYSVTNCEQENSA